MNAFIQYEGFTLVGADRVYKFSANGTSDERRHFTVDIPAASFISAQFKFQDGPPISFHRIKQELDQETTECPAPTHLTISGLDIADYLLTQHPKKAANKKRMSASAPAHDIA